MAYRLNPSYPLLWRDTHTAQIGFDQPLVVLEHLEAGYWYLLDALRSGIGLSGLTLIAEQHQIQPAALEQFLRQLAPALTCGEQLPKNPETSLPELPKEAESSVLSPLEFFGEQELVHRLQSLIPEQILGAAAAPPLVILCERYLIPPQCWQPVLQSGQPHLPIVFGDQSVTVGPLVSPGATPCLYCQYLWREETEPWLATLYSQTHQLPGTRPRQPERLLSEQGSLFWSAVTELSWQLDQYRENRVTGSESVQYLIGGEVIRQQWRQHPECYCQTMMPEIEKAA